MDKHNSQQKNKHKTAKGHPSAPAASPVMPEPAAARDETAVFAGKKPAASNTKKK